MVTNKKPANQLRCGNIKATIWENLSEKGLFFSTKISPVQGSVRDVAQWELVRAQ